MIDNKSVTPGEGTGHSGLVPDCLERLTLDENRRFNRPHSHPTIELRAQNRNQVVWRCLDHLEKPAPFRVEIRLDSTRVSHPDAPEAPFSPTGPLNEWKIEHKSGPPVHLAGEKKIWGYYKATYKVRGPQSNPEGGDIYDPDIRIDWP